MGRSFVPLSLDERRIISRMHERKTRQLSAPGLVANFVFNPMLTMGGEISVPNLKSVAELMILNVLAERLKRHSQDDVKGRHFEARLIVQAVCWYLRYPLSYRDLEEMFPRARL